MQVSEITNKIFLGDSKEILKDYPDNCVDLVVTSPPYYNLRDYKHNDQIGNEQDVDHYIHNLRFVFANCKRILKDTGAIFVNISDSYDDNKSLVGVPEEFVRMMTRGLGLYRRNTIIWEKNPLPESAKDRFSNNFEYFYFFTKSSKKLLWKNEKTKEWRNTLPPNISRGKGIEGIDWIWTKNRKGETVKKNLWNGYDYYFNTQYQPYAESSLKQFEQAYNGQAKKDYEGNGVQNASDTKRRIVTSIRYGGNKYSQNNVNNNTYSGKNWEIDLEKGAIKKCIWKISTNNSNENHFATYPEELIRTPILACTDESEHNLILDPFMGTGTTAVLAQKMGRNFTGVELNEQYYNITKRRLNNMISTWLRNG